jgi:ElaB/YqjD/DUF883 family membrane-anchored ribosome-binding protein
MASNNPSSNLERAAEAADDFEKKHYQGGELDAQDFKKAGENATAAVSNAATAVKEAVVGPADPKGPVGGAMPGKAGAAADAAQRKAVASSPAEARPSVLSQLVDKILPTAEAETRTSGQKWEDAKEEARESGREAKASVRDAASALAGDTRRGVDKADRETRGFLNRAGEATAGTAERGADLTRDAGDRVRRDWPGAEVRGVVEETKDLTRSAADRVKEDWQRTKEGTQEMLDNSSAARQWRADHAPAPQKERGFFGSITHALFGSNDGEEVDAKARDAANRTRASARSAADDVSDKAHEAKENTKSFFNQAGDEAQRQADRAEDKTRGFFGRASDETRRTADRAEDKTRGFFGRAADDTRRSADRAEDHARGFWNRTKDDADRLGDRAEAKFNRWGDRINESVEDTKHAVQHKWNQAEDYLEADLRPRSASEAAVQAGYIPSNTQDVLASRGGRRY